MSKEIQEYILNYYRYRSFSPTDITKETNKYYNEVCETVKQMEKAGVVEWKKEQGKYVVLKDYIPQTYTGNEITSSAYVYEKSKNDIEEFANKVPDNIEIKKLKGLVPTKSNVNGVITQIQNNLVKQNQHIIDVYEAFGSVYETFDKLDEIYIKRIIANLKSAEEANKKAVRGLEENQKLMKSQKMVIEVLKKHKDDLDELQNLKDIDMFYDEYQAFKTSQEDAFDEVYASQELVVDKILHLQEDQTTTTQQLTNLDDEYQGFKASQEKALGELHTSQESMAGQFSAFQEEYNKISQVQTESLAETKRLQEEAGKKIQYLSIGLGVNFVAVVVLLILLVSGVF
ncbi:hypothetical protein Si082_00188 [Streptococcus infantarius subsp. infantarius]|nr:hypothetical protein [Streptococcus infantarius subsp. infantarius]